MAEQVVQEQESANSEIPEELRDALKKCITARKNIGVMIVLTLITMFLTFIKSRYGFPFSAFLPQLFVGFGGLSEAGALKLVWYGLSGGLILLFTACWLFCLIRPWWYVFALLLFIGDSLALGWFSTKVDDPSWIDIGFHIWILYYMFVGVVGSFRARKLLPPDGSIPQASPAKLSSLFNSEETIKETALMALLIEHPEMADEFDLTKLDMTALSILLKAKPELVAKCDLSALNIQAAADLIIEVPTAADKYDLTKFGGEQWESILLVHPEFVDKLEKYGQKLLDGDFAEFWQWLNMDAAQHGTQRAMRLRDALQKNANAGGIVSRKILDFAKEAK